MNKTLFIGCSHLSGIYDSDNNIIDNTINYATIARDKLNDTGWKIISCPGDGIMMYASIIETLYQHGLLQDFKNVIVQHTYEPRLNIEKHENNILNGIVEYISNDDYSSIYNVKHDWLLSMHVLSQYNIYKDMFFENSEKEFLEYLDHINSHWDKTETIITHYNSNSDEPHYKNMYVDSSYRYIELLLKELDINLYSFRWWNCLRDTSYIKNREMIFEQSIYDLVNKNFKNEEIRNVWSTPGSHPTKKVVEFVGENLAQRLIENGYE